MLNSAYSGYNRIPDESIETVLFEEIESVRRFSQMNTDKSS